MGKDDWTKNDKSKNNKKKRKKSNFTDCDNFGNNKEWEYEEIYKEIKTLDDLIELGKIYDHKKRKRYNIDLRKLNRLVKPLTELKNLIGMDKVKKTIVGHIVYYVQDLEDNSNNMMHTVIQGPPGVGKTMLGRLIGDIYFNLGMFKSSFCNHRFKEYRDRYTFHIARRSDLIGRYLGETSIKTQEFINKCNGGVMFIDEAYSLGNAEGRDSYSKECIDTINQNLTENKGNFLCIIAGYKEDLEHCFFAYNSGLKRRFPFVYEIEKYTHEEIKEIFFKMVYEIGWCILSIEDNFFEKKYEYFPNYGGDMETLLFKCKIEHSKRIFCLPKENKKRLTKEDINNGFNEYKLNVKIKKTDNTSISHLYL